MRIGYRLLFITLLGALLAPAAQAQDWEEFGTLRAGESITFKGVELSCRLIEADANQEPEAQEPLPQVLADPNEPGLSREERIRRQRAFVLDARQGARTQIVSNPVLEVTFRGPSGEVGPVRLAGEGKDSQAVVYLGDVFFACSVDWAKSRGRNRVRSGGDAELAFFFIQYRARTAAPRRSFAGPGQTLYLSLSHVTPVQWNEWKLSLSDEPVEYPDGSRYFEITARNETTSEEIRLPAYPNSQRKVGRFEVYIQETDEKTATVQAQVKVNPDPTIRGRDAYVEHLEKIASESTGAFLERMAEQYGFRVEWVEKPAGRPESVEALKGTIFALPRIGNVTVERALNMWRQIQNQKYEHNGPLAAVLEWKDNDTLRVWAKNYEIVIAQRQADREREESLQRVKQVFERDFKLELKVYRLSSITPVTAKALIEPELDTYALVVRRGDALEAPEFEDERFAIIPRKQLKWTRSQIENKAIDLIAEEAIADEKAEALLVTAIPKTHEKIQVLIKEMDGLIEPASSAQRSVARHRIEIALLEGSKTKRVTLRRVARTRILNSMEGKVIAIEVEPGDRVRPGQIIAKLEPTDAEYRVLKVRFDSLKQQLESRLRDFYSSQKRLEAGVASARELREEEREVRQLESQVQELRILIEDREKKLIVRSHSPGAIEQVYVHVDQFLPIGSLVATLNLNEDEEIALTSQTSGFVELVPRTSGSLVTAGEVIVKLETQHNAEMTQMLRARLAQVEISAIRYHSGAEIVQTLADIDPSEALGAKEIALQMKALESQIEIYTRQIRDLQEQVRQSEIKAPRRGILRLLGDPKVGDYIDRGQVLALLEPAPAEPVDLPAKAAPADFAARYGISVSDLKPFGLESVTELATAVVTLASVRGEAGHVRVMLGGPNARDSFICELSFDDERPPYVIVRGTLSAAPTFGENQPRFLLENTFFLEEDKPAIAGLTNLREALILVLRLHEEP